MCHRNFLARRDARWWGIGPVILLVLCVTSCQATDAQRPVPKEVRLPIIAGNTWASDVAVSNDGRRLLISASPRYDGWASKQAGIWVVDLAAAKAPHQLTSGHVDAGPCWAGNEKQVLFVRQMSAEVSGIWAVNLQTGREYPVFSLEDWSAWTLAAAPAGSLGASLVLRGGPPPVAAIVVFDWTSGRREFWSGSPSASPTLSHGPVWSPEGRYIAFFAESQTDPRLTAVRLDTKTMKTTVVSTPYESRMLPVRDRPVLGGLGNRLAFSAPLRAGRRQPVTRVALAEVDFRAKRSRQTTAFTVADGRVSQAVVNPAFPREVAIVSLSGGVHMVRVFRQGAERFRARPALGPTWSADGRMLAYLIPHDKAGIVRLHDGKQR